MKRKAWRFLLFLHALVISATAGTLHYVSVNSPAPAPPYTNWDTAATQIQDAIDAAQSADEIVVADGIYSTGGRPVSGTLTNRIAVDKPLTIRSLNGPESTLILGVQSTNLPANDAVRCAYLSSGAILSGFTLTNGGTLASAAMADYAQTVGGAAKCESTQALLTNCILTKSSAYDSGGAVYSGTLENCTLSGNHAGSGGAARNSALNHCLILSNSANSCGGVLDGTLTNCLLNSNVSTNNGGAAVGGSLFGCTLSANSAGRDGGGAYHSSLFNCLITDNIAVGYGGGACDYVVRNCTIVSNHAAFGGGVFNTTIYNSIVYYNSASRVGTNYYSPYPMEYCCSWPRWNSGMGNFSNPPAFLNPAAGDFHLRSNSPCINAGLNFYSLSTTDFDGNPRVIGGTVDVGALEFLSPQSVISYAWLQSFGLPTDGSADHADPDGDGLDNWSEWRCHTVPTNSLSALRLISAKPDGTNVIVTWESVGGMRYFVQRCTNLSVQPIFHPRITNLLANPGTMSYTDFRAAGLSPLFYRVGVGEQ